MREKKPSLIVTFHTTTAAMGAEKLCMSQGVPGRLIPVPREITAGCGLAWKAAPEEESRIAEALRGGSIEWAAMQVITV